MDSNKGQSNAADEVELNAKEENLGSDQGDKLKNGQSCRDMGGKKNDRRGSKYNTQEGELDSNKRQLNPTDKVKSNAKEENLDSDQGDKIENDQSHSGTGGKSFDSRNSKYKTQESELDQGQKSSAHSVESNAKEENLDNDDKHLESKTQDETIKISGEKKEPEWVLDGTKVSNMEARTSMSTGPLDPDSEIPGVVEKAVALKNFVKVKSVVALLQSPVSFATFLFRYLRTVEELRRVELQDIRREDNLAFFINLYNMMVIHAILVWGHPDGAIERRKLFGDFKYMIGGSVYSLSDIQNGILRGNQRPPYNLMKPFNPKDKRVMMALPYAEPLIHFALVFGTRSGPALRCYSPGDIDKELMEASLSFLRNGGLIIDFETKVASATKILTWFSIDFGKNEMEVLKNSSNYLEPAISEALLELLATSQLKVIYQPYDWGLNCTH